MQLAQVTVSRLLAPLSSPQLAGFVAAAADVEAAGTAAPGFRWRRHVELSPGARLHPFAPEIGDSAGLVVNLSVWDDLDTLYRYVRTGPHRDAMRRRRSWFVADSRPMTVLWWVADNHRPGMGEAAGRLRRLREQGPGPSAFTAARPYPPPGAAPDRQRAASPARQEAASPGQPDARPSGDASGRPRPTGR